MKKSLHSGILRMMTAGILCCLLPLSACGSTAGAAGSVKGERSEWTGSGPSLITLETSSSVSYDEETGIEADLSLTDSGQIQVAADEEFGDGLIRLVCPDGSEAPYPFSVSALPDSSLTCALTGGSGEYRLDVLKRTENTGKYAFVYSTSFEAGIEDPYTPFLLPNHFVNWKEGGPVAEKAALLSEESATDLEFAGKVYEYLISSFTYDEYAASQTRSDYVPDPDAFTGKSEGIAYDMAALMAAMLRSGGVPAKLCVGYSRDTFHVWVSAYLTEAGDASEVIHSPGREWVLLDPVLGTANDPGEVKKYVQDLTNYVVLYSY